MSVRRRPLPARASAPLWPGLVAIIGLVPLACGTPSGPEMAPVSGTVTVRGEPATRGIVTFYPVDAGKASPAMGAIGPDGSYTMQTTRPGDGVRPGEYRVAVSLKAGEETMEEAVKNGARKRMAAGGPWEKYERPETSNLTATVKSGRNVIPFDLR